MKPILLKFRAFGPYIDEQTIDFNDLSKVGLFLICGETGERVIIVTGCINVLVSRVSGTLTKYNSCIA